jgi:hypothetical protein
MVPEDPESEGEETYVPSGYWDDPEIERLGSKKLNGAIRRFWTVRWRPCPVKS